MQFFLINIVSKYVRNSNIIAAILNSTQQPGCVFVTSFRLRDFVQMASDKFFNHHSGLWLLLSHIILSQKCGRHRNSEDSEADNNLEKIDSADLVRDVKSVASFSPSN